jgi:hypothetical protein
VFHAGGVSLHAAGLVANGPTNGLFQRTFAHAFHSENQLAAFYMTVKWRRVVALL